MAQIRVVLAVVTGASLSGVSGLLQCLTISYVALCARAVASVPAEVTCEPYLKDDRLALTAEGDTVRPIKKADARALTLRKWTKHLHRGRPVVLRGGADALFEGWNTSWQVNGLLRSMSASHPFACGDSEHFDDIFQTGGKIEKGVWAPKMSNLIDLYNATSRMVHWRAMRFSMIRKGPTSRDRHRHHPLFKEYFWKLKPHSFLSDKDARQVDPSQFFLHFSNQGGSMPHEHPSALNTLFQGAKRWIISDPKGWHIARDEGRREFSVGREFRHGARTFNTSLKWFEEVAPSIPFPHYDFVQLQGESVYVPNGFVHTSIDLCKHTVGAVLMGNVIEEQTSRSQGRSKHDL